MPSLTAIQVIIGRKEDGSARYPDWTLLPSFNSEALVKAACPHGWHYDKISGHDDDDVDSPIDTQRGVRLVTPAMAAEAVAMFGGAPFNVTQLTEAQLTTFWETNHTAHVPSEKVDYEEIIALKAAWDLVNDAGLGFPQAAKNKIKARIEDAFDVAKAHPGFRTEKIKTWTSVKARWNITYVEPT